jgi:DNA-binding transcriptional MerR regulator
MKLYFSIGEVAEMLQVKTSTLRHWEKEFPQLRPQKMRSGERRYVNEDITLLKEIKKLRQEMGFTIDGSRKVLSQRESIEKNAVHLRTIEMQLISMKERLEALKKSLKISEVK